nr:ISAs1 family transposase [Bremerella cremea]
MSGPAALIYKQFVKVTDPRADRGKNHDLLEMIFLALTATICGANSWADVERFANAKRDWFRRYVKLEHGVPSHDTFGRVFARLDTGQFLAAMHGWVDQLAATLRPPRHPAEPTPAAKHKTKLPKHPAANKTPAPKARSSPGRKSPPANPAP